MIFVYKFKSEDYHDWLVMSAVDQSKECWNECHPFASLHFEKNYQRAITIRFRTIVSGRYQG